MPRRPTSFRAAVALVALAFTLLVGGCSSVVTGVASADPAPRPAEGVGADPVAWMDKVCGSFQPMLDAAQKTPDLANARDLPTIKKSFSDYLGAVLAGVQQARSQLRAAGKAPVSGGDDVVGRIDGLYGQFETSLSEAKTRVDGVDPNDATAFQAALTDATNSLTKLSQSGGGLGDTKPFIRLNRAADAAPNCQKLGSR
ncbi:hypothetical protein [Pseudonocardia sp. N23]|uniref:hypothetical protein n=1 Tax=Pseudonocardia sp. N23 TaxID=1987376 RepID=UPI000BFC6D10|nr:hypothetical protein [Pseudonocardia sp. N23]GAY09306.1 hypothetical protein TOK_3264 [Pseudonocardia sp. N23]